MTEFFKHINIQFKYLFFDQIANYLNKVNLYRNYIIAKNHY